MEKHNCLVCSKIRWRGREAYSLSNGLFQMVNLTGGGHIAEVSFTKGSGLPVINPLWIPQWKSMEPFQYRTKTHAKTYGSLNEGKLLSGIMGHNICLDHFGSPSDDEAAQGLSTHGEAPSLKWRKSNARLTARLLGLTLSVRLPEAGLKFSRQIEVRAGESVIYIKETVVNERKFDHFFDWVQHVTLAPPFLTPEDGRVFASATKGVTSPDDYKGESLLKSGKEFQWPKAPASSGGKADLSHCLAQKGRGIVASVLMDPDREIQFVGSLNTRHRVLYAYCFRRSDYPWLTIWEENCVRQQAPWNGHAQTRGLEFGSAPLPTTRKEAFARGPLLGTPTFSTVPGRGRITVPYIAFLAHLPEGFDTVRNISLGKNEIIIQGRNRNQQVQVPASGLAATGLV